MCAGREREKVFRPLPHYAPTGCAQHLYRRIRFLTICIHGHASHGAAWHIPWMHEYATPISTGRVSMAEIRGVEEGFLSSVFGKWLVVSPKTEVWRCGDVAASSLFCDSWGRDICCGRLKAVAGATRGIARVWPHCGKCNIAILVEFGVWLFRNGAFVWYWLRENYRTGKEITWRKHSCMYRNARCVMPRFKPKTRESSVDSTKTIA